MKILRMIIALLLILCGIGIILLYVFNPSVFPEKDRGDRIFYGVLACWIPSVLIWPDESNNNKDINSN